MGGDWFSGKVRESIRFLEREVAARKRGGKMKRRRRKERCQRKRSRRKKRKRKERIQRQG